MNKCPVVLIYGPPAAGKLTVAKALSQKENMFLLDNHHFNNVIMPFVDVNKTSLPEINTAIYQIRSIALKTIQKYKKESAKGFVFSNVLLDTPDDAKAVRELENFAAETGGAFIPVSLVCDTETLLCRVNSEERRQKCKITDPAVLKLFLKTQPFLKIHHPNLLTLDSKKLSVPELVSAICGHLKKF